MTTTLPNRIIKYFVDTSNPSQSGFYFYEKAGTGGFVRLGALADTSRAGGNTFEIDSSTAENVIYNGLGGADTYVVRSNLDKNIEISDPHTGDDGSGNEAKNTIVFDSNVTLTSINQVTGLEGTGGLRIELTLDTGAVITVNGPDVFQYVVGGATALDFAGFIATYGDSGIAPANRAPVFENVPTDLSIDENADGSAVPVSVGRVVASDADAADTLTYSIVSAVDQNGGNVTGFEVDGDGLITYVGTGLDAETITSVALTVSASDGQESAQTSVAISVADLNDEAPTITSGATDDALTECVAVPNTQVIYTATGISDVTDISWSLSGPDADLFNIDRATGEVRFNTETTPDHEVKDSYNFTVVATSGSLAAVEQAVTIAVTDIDERSFRVTSDGDRNAAVAGDVLTFGRRSSDPDFTYQWYRDGIDIAGATGASYTITEGDEGNSLYVVARYIFDNGSGVTATSFGIIVPASMDNADSSSTATPSEAPAILSLADLNPASGFRIGGEAGWAVSSAGDVNGDGIDDFAIGTFWGGPIGGLRGSTYVVFGKANGFNAAINLRSLNAGDGFRIDGENFGLFNGEFISAGDVNGDGYDDIIIGAYVADYNGGDSGSTYVVFGKESGFSRTMDLSELDGSDGFRIDGESAGDFSGYSVSSAGDFNGDGYDDVIIGAQYADYNGIHSGSTYVVFGKESGFSRTTGLSEIDGSDGFRIDGESAHDYSGYSVSSAGDINGDGYDDIIVSARRTDSNEHRGNGSSYVIFGKESGFSRTMDLSELDGSNGFRMDLSGRSISSAGDINGDGYDDIIIEASSFGAASSLGPLTYVVFGKESGFSRTVDLSELDGSDGFSINRSGGSVSSAGDFNGDGYDDIIIGAPRAGLDGNIYGQSSYVVFGKESGFSRRMDLSELDGSDGFRIDGGSAFSFARLSVSSAGDVNDDGYDDIMIGKSSYGTSYIIYGRATSSVTDAEEDTATPANIIVKYFVDTSNPSQSGFYFYEVAGDDNLVRLDRAHEGTLGGDDTFEIDSPTAENVIYNGLGGADTYVIRGRLDNDVQIHDIDFGDDGSGNEVKNTIVFASDVTVTSIYQDRLQGRADVIKIEQTLDTDAVVTVHVPDAFEYVVGGAAALDFAEFIATYGASGISATNRAPVFENEPTDLSINENADGSAVPVSVGRVVATDADAGDTLTYSIISTADQNGDSVTGFEVDGTGLITYVGTGLDAETITSVALTVSASDGQESAQTSVAISVTNIDEGNASFVVTSDGDINAAVAGDVLTVALRSSDPDGDGAFTYQWYRDGADIAGATGARYTITEGDEGNSLYVAVRYTDGSGADETVTASGIIVPVPEDNADSSLTATPAVLNLADINPATGVRLDGEDGYHYLGRGTSGVGDINGDGIDDFAIGAAKADRNGRTESGSTYIVYGDENGFDASINLASLNTSDGFRLDGENAYDWSGLSVSGVGDINRDGIDDFAIGAPLADPNGRSDAGATYIIYGKDSSEGNYFTSNIDLSNLANSDGSRLGIRINGENGIQDGSDPYGDWSGYSVSTGDINNDGYNDIIIGVHDAEWNGDGSGSTYVIFGNEDGLNADIELSSIANGDGRAGFRIDGERQGDLSGLSVSGVGDINNDGHDDIIIGASHARPNGYNSGSTYVVFGKVASDLSSGTIDLATIVASNGRAGFRIDGERTYDFSGGSVSVGDINNDGYDDIIIGASWAEPNGTKSGSTYVVFGKAASNFSSGTIDLATVVASNGSSGFRIDGERTYDFSGYSVDSAGDFNGDGYDDIIIGAVGVDSNGASGNGSTYVVFGKAGGFRGTIELSELDGSDGFRLDGESTYAGSGRAVSSAGDVNHDGYDDILIRASWSSYVIYGHATSGTSGITPAPANRAPVFENEPTGLSINENADGSAVPVSVGRVAARDADAGDTLTYSIVSTADQNGDSVTGFEVDGTGLITYVGIGLDAETITSVALTVSASDGQESAETSVAISVVDLNDEAPTITSGTTDDALTEGVAVPNTQVIYTATGTSDVTDISWSLSGPDAGLFNINPATGEVRFETETTPDAEAKDSYSFTVVATSGTLASVEQAVSIAVTNIDEGNASFVVTSNRDINAAVAGDVLTVGLRSSDPDGDGTFSYQWYRDGVDIAGATGASYTITEADGGNSLYVAVRYTDGSGADETVTASGVIVPAPVDNIAAVPLPATPAILNLANLDPTIGFRLIGEDGFGASFGSAVSSVGDINGDGYDDFAIGAYGANLNGASSGSTYVVFGKESDFSGAIDLSELDGSDGFRINGEGRWDKSGFSVSSGDVNGDGYDDIIIGAPWADPNGASSGSTYVVFGKESGFGRIVSLSNIVRSGSGGVRIDGENTGDWSGYSVSAGDVNGDGYDDIIIGAQNADFNEGDSGSTYVVFGKADGSNGLNGTIELSELDGSDGFRLNGENAVGNHGWSVSAGDINGDGYDDIITGAPEADNGASSGSTYVVFGKESGFSRVIELSELDGSDGFRIDGESGWDWSGYSVSSTGDINGDGYDDVITGAPWTNSNGHNSGSTYVVFGKESGFSRTIELSELDGSDGFRIDGENTGDWSGYSVSSAGDFNGDGYDDVIIGARYADPNGVKNSGSTYVVFGKESGFSRVIDLSELDSSDGFRINGENRGDYSGHSVSSAGDINGDGYDDIIIGADGADPNGSGSGSSYIIYGHATSGANIDEGNASFVVTSNRDINAAVAGDVLTVGLISSDPDGDGTFTYQWYRDGVDIAGATGASYTIPEDYDGNSIYVVVRYTDGSGTDETVTASGIIVPVLADNDDDASEDPVNTTYTMTQAPTGVSLTRGGVALSVGETFTHQDIQGGSVALTVNDENALSGLRLTTDDGTDANPAEISLDIEVREVADIAAPEAGNDLDYSENEGSLVIDTGDYGDQITAAQGSDFITGGLGDDTINLDSGDGGGSGQDTVVYNFGSGSIFTATDGGDDITGFKRGEDIFLLKTESDNPELATLDGLFSYVSGPNKGSSHDDLMIVRPNYEYEPDGDGGHIFFLTGITFHFEDAGVYGNGYLAQGHVSITFDERLPWEEFLSLIEIDNGNGSIDGNFDHRRGIIRDLSTLPNLMGEGSLAYEVEAPAQTPPQDVDVVPLEDDIPATSFDVV